MSEETALIKYVEDKTGEVFFPVTHQTAVFDDDGITIAQKFTTIEDLIGDIDSVLDYIINNESE